MILLGEARGVSVIHRDSIEGRATPLRVLPRVSRHTVWVAYYGCEHTDRAGVRQGVRTVSLYGSYSTTGNIFHRPHTPRALRAPEAQADGCVAPRRHWQTRVQPPESPRSRVQKGTATGSTSPRVPLSARELVSARNHSQLTSGLQAYGRAPSPKAKRERIVKRLVRERVLFVKMHGCIMPERTFRQQAACPPRHYGRSLA